jgi:hypothetical protein
MREFIKNPKFRNGYFWLSLVALIFSAAGIDFNTLTSWQLLGEALLSILNNPVSVVAVITAMLGIWNNNDTKGLDPIKNKKDKEI